MSPWVVLLAVWALVTGVFVLLLIYRSVIGMRESDQLFLDKAEDGLAQEQRDVVARLNRTSPYVKALGAGSGVLLVAAAGFWLYEALYTIR